MGILEAILAVFTAVGSWLQTAVTNLIPIFWADGSLTFMGVLAVAGLAFSVIFLVVAVIRRFLHFGG